MNTDPKKYQMNLSVQQITEMVRSAKSGAEKFNNPDGIKTAFSLLDITSLNATDTEKKILSFGAEKIFTRRR